MGKISLCMIVKNEENYIENCLKSIYDIVDEIIIVDTGSNDETKNICKKYTNNIYDFEWVNDFSAARNFSFSKATCEYIMWLDADDILKEDDRNKLKLLKENLENIKEDHISMYYNYSFNSDGKPSLTFKRNRIVKKDSNFNWVGCIHEVIDTNILDAYSTDIYITHTRSHSNTDRNLKIFMEKDKEGKITTTRDILYFAKELFYNNKFYKSLEKFNEYMTREDVWIEDKIDAYIKMSDCYAGLELKHKQFESDDEKVYVNYKDKQKYYLMETFKLTYPRAEALYRLSNVYIEEKRYYEAILYLESIFKMPYPKDCAGFLNNDMWDFLPHLQLCFCYYNVGDINKSIYHHNKCLELRPNDQRVISNEEFFCKLKRKED